MDEILTAEQVAKILQVHPFTVLKFIKNGKLKASKLGRVYRIRRSDVDKFLDEQIEKVESSKTPSKGADRTTEPVDRTTEPKIPNKKDKKVKEAVKPAESKEISEEDIDHYIIKVTE